MLQPHENATNWKHNNICLQNDDTTEYKSINKNYAQARSQNIETVRRRKFHYKNALNGSWKATVSPDWTGTNHSNQKSTPMPRARCIKINEHQPSMSFTKTAPNNMFFCKQIRNNHMPKSLADPNHFSLCLTESLSSLQSEDCYPGQLFWKSSKYISQTLIQFVVRMDFMFFLLTFTL